MEGKNVKPKRGKNIVLRLLALLVTVALVLGAVALVVFRDQLNIDALRRWSCWCARPTPSACTPAAAPGTSTSRSP